jgi:hypothetical protein
VWGNADPAVGACASGARIGGWAVADVASIHRPGLVRYTQKGLIFYHSDPALKVYLVLSDQCRPVGER